MALASTQWRPSTSNTCSLSTVGWAKRSVRPVCGAMRLQAKVGTRALEGWPQAAVQFTSHRAHNGRGGDMQVVQFAFFCISGSLLDDSLFWFPPPLPEEGEQGCVEVGCRVLTPPPRCWRCQEGHHTTPLLGRHNGK